MLDVITPDPPSHHPATPNTTVTETTTTHWRARRGGAWTPWCGTRQAALDALTKET